MDARGEGGGGEKVEMGRQRGLSTVCLLDLVDEATGGRTHA